ncbi:hypothetical protein [Streptomyces sp. NPDC088757]|uniref:hypothetical protein n=1 Tax=Streptomyces sp. NPDC088757 TaxID=3365889 RepID=UPI003807C8D7
MRRPLEFTAHWRAPAGTHKQTVLAFGIVAAVLVFGGSGTSAGGGPGMEQLPAPRSSSVVTYPIERPGWEKPVPRKAPVPTVSYPIKWDRDGDGR